jgi:hypothetical protein
MSEFYVIRTIRGRRYLYKERRQRGHKPVSICLGPIDPARRRRRTDDAPSPVRRIAMLAVGVEDDYGRRVDSLWNRYVNKEPKKAEPAKQEAPVGDEGQEEGAGAGNSEDGDSSEQIAFLDLIGV